MTSKLTAYDELFRRKLLEIWNQSIEIVASDLDKELLETLQKEIALKFYEDFKDTPIEVKFIQDNFDEYHSVWVHPKNRGAGGIDVPLFFIERAKRKEKPGFDDVFEKEINWIDTLSYLYEKDYKYRMSLREADVKIIQALTSYQNNMLTINHFDNIKKHKIPFQTKSLANATRLSYSYLAKRLKFLENNYIIRVNYLLNSLAFGFDLFVIIYDSKLNQSIEEKLYGLTLYYHTFATGLSARVIQLPTIRFENWKDNFDFALEILEVSEMIFSNQLSELSAQKKQSFKRVPNFEARTLDIQKQQFLNKNSIRFQKTEFLNWFEELKNLQQDNTTSETYFPFSSLAKLSPSNRIKKIIKIINYIAMFGVPITSLENAANQIGVTELQFVDVFNYLLHKDLLGIISRVTYIGCNIRFGVFVKSSSNNLLNEIHNNFIMMAESRLYKGENFIFAYVMMPEHWLADFIQYLIRLKHSSQHIEVHYEMILAFQTWAQFTIPISKNMTIDELGIHLESIQIE